MQEAHINSVDVTDVEFKEIPVEKKADIFNPVTYLTNAFQQSGLVEASENWKKNIDPRAETAADEKERIFFANRALRLFISEQADRENITPRMLLADGIDGAKWAALMDQGVIPWFLNQFDKKGKRVQPEEAASAADDDNRISARSDGDLDDYNAKVASGEIIPADSPVLKSETVIGDVDNTPPADGIISDSDVKPVESASIIGIDVAEGADQTSYARGAAPSLYHVDDSPFQKSLTEDKNPPPGTVEY